MTWYVLRTTPQKEFALVGRYIQRDEAKEAEWIAGILERKGYTVFLPTLTARRRIGRRAKRRRLDVTYPMFTGYIFVRGPVSWLHLLAENYVLAVVKRDGCPAVFPDSSIARLKAVSGRAVPNRKASNTRKSFVAGDMAEISSGPFAGQMVPISSIKGKNAKVLIDLFGGVKEAEILLEDLEAA